MVPTFLGTALLALGLPGSASDGDLPLTCRGEEGGDPKSESVSSRSTPTSVIEALTMSKIKDDGDGRK